MLFTINWTFYRLGLKLGEVIADHYSLYSLQIFYMSDSCKNLLCFVCCIHFTCIDRYKLDMQGERGERHATDFPGKNQTTEVEVICKTT